MYKKIYTKIEPHQRRTNTKYKFIRDEGAYFKICVIMYAYNNERKPKVFNKQCCKSIYNIEHVINVRNAVIECMNFKYSL